MFAAERHLAGQNLKCHHAEGKKIGWRDGFRALYAIAKYNFLR